MGQLDDPRGGEATSQWFVSVALPIEAGSPAEAVREFWAYVHRLGPRELPAYVWPRGDELAMRAYVLADVALADVALAGVAVVDMASLDPEEDDRAPTP